jgi:hypothetical protein
MPPTASDILMYGPLELPLNDDDELGGGIDTGNQIQGNTTGELFTKRLADAYGGSDVEAFTKCFVKNAHASDTAYNLVAWLANGCILPVAEGAFSFVSTSASDDATKYIHAIFEKTDGTYDTEDIALNGTSVVNGASLCGAGANVKFELRLDSDDSLTTAAGIISCNRGILLGVIPAGYKTADSHILMAMASAINDTDTTTDRLTAPTGPVFTRPNTQASGLPFADDLAAGDAQGIWLKQVLPDGAISSPELQCVIGWAGEDS